MFAGALRCRQFRHGYRYSVDSLLLAHFANIGKQEKILDLGTGCGIVSLVLLYRHNRQTVSVTGLEAQAELAELAETNHIANGLHHRFRLIHGCVEEITSLIGAETHSLVVCNPPFFRAGSGRQNLNRQACRARHQGPSGIMPFLAAAAFGVKNKGHVALVYPAEKVVELITSLQRFNLEPKRIRPVYSYPGTTSQARLVLVEARKNGSPGLKLLAPLYIYRSRGGSWSDEVADMYQPQETDDVSKGFVGAVPASSDQREGISYVGKN